MLDLERVLREGLPEDFRVGQSAVLSAQLSADVLEPTDDATELERDYEEWLRTLFPAHFTAEMALHHHAFWHWLDELRKGVRPDNAFIAAWNRGGAKSTNLEAGGVRVGARRVRRFLLYVCEIQDQADDHVGNIESMLSGKRIGELYPALTTRALTKYGTSKGWSGSLLRTAAGFNVLALGLDSAARGAKLDEVRPDIVFIDDIDDQEDTVRTVDKKVRMITRKIIPAGSPDLAIVYGQNLVHKESVMARLCGVAEKPADFLQKRIVSGPIPAVRDLAWEWKEREDGRRLPTIVGGEATWPEGKPLETCQAEMDDWGVSAFLAEAQHNVEAPPGGMYDHVEFVHAEHGAHPDFVVTTVWVDPAVTDKEESDSHGIHVEALGTDDKLYSLFAWERRCSPEEALELAIVKAFEWDSPIVGVETDQGGDLWAGAFERALQQVYLKHPGLKMQVKLRKKTPPRFVPMKAGEGHGSKVHRQQLVLADYETGKIVHLIGTHNVLEAALKRFPKTKPLDLADARYWSWWWLRNQAVGARQMRDQRRGRR